MKLKSRLRQRHRFARLRSMNRLLLPAAAFAIALAVGGTTSRAATQENRTALRAAMRDVLASLEVVLPAGVNRQQSLSAKERARFAAALDQLIARAEVVDRHGIERGRGFRNLSSSLLTDLAEARRHLDRGSDESARYYLVQATSNCVACHSRLPSDASAPFGVALYERLESKLPSAHEQAQILVATRQFDKAVAIWEKLFRDLKMAPDQLDLGGYLSDYLTVQIRVRRDLTAPQPVLKALAKRADTPLYLRSLLEAWTADLAAHAGEFDQGAARARNAETARSALLDRARELTATSSGRPHLVSDLLASSLLLQYIEAADEDDASLPEAYLMLGRAEARGADGYWIPQTEAHLEAAVRSDPASPFADEAYLLLEEYLVTGHGGIGDDFLPLEKQEQLFELRNLLQAAKRREPDLN